MNTPTRTLSALILLAALAGVTGCDRRTGDGAGAPAGSTSLPPAAPAPEMAASPASR
jgi:hypothetical protein